MSSLLDLVVNNPLLLAEAALNGVLLGGVLALLALGLNLIFGVLDIVWIVYVDLVMLAMYAVYFLVMVYGWPLWLGALGGVALGVLLGVAVHLLIITPMILPIALRAGIDPVHLGVVMSYNLSLGLVTPPFGSVMFVVCGIGKTTIADFTRELLPFLAILVVVLGVITYIPGSVTWLPDLIMGVD